MDRDIVVIAESTAGRALPVTHELLAFARALAESADRVCVVLPGRDVQAAARVLARETGADCLALEGDALEPYNAEVWTAALALRLATQKPRYILVAHTSRGCDVAPALAVRIGAACITAVEGFQRIGGVIGFSRSIFNGKVKMHLAPQTGTAVLAVLPGACAAATASHGSSLARSPVDGQRPAPPAPGMTDGPPPEALETVGESPEASAVGMRSPAPPATAGRVDVFPFHGRPRQTRALGVAEAGAQDLDLTLADVVVCAGRGVGSAENIDGVRRLAALFPKSAVACSRPVCDLGWMDYRHQVGLTGRTVAPKLYIACGVSGAAQHLAGMRGAGFVVAVNKDPHAAIFQVADVGVVEDLAAFIPLLISSPSMEEG
jgi:electron transfer flavoprotein alpha subunit